MKTTLMLALVASLSIPAAAHGGKRMKKEVESIKEAAVEIRPNNPGLASRLDELAQREQSAAESGTEEGSPQDRTDARLLKEAAGAVKTTRPDLSKKLDKYASKENRESKRERSRSY